MRALNLATVCEEAACPNIGECWTKKHATVMILGDTCTRACAFCNVKTGMPRAVDPLEPEHVAVAAAELGLEHIVVTSVDRDDLPDGGASQFVKVIEALRRNTPEHDDRDPDPRFPQQGRGARSRRSSRRGPTSTTTISRRCRGSIRRSARARVIMRRCGCSRASSARLRTSSPSRALMVGLGEQRLEVHQVMDDMRSAGVDFLTMGQYLQPTPRHAKVEEFVTPQAFEAYAAIARAKGFLLVAASPLTRSSYHAGDDFEKMQAARGGQAGSGRRPDAAAHRDAASPYTPEQLFDLVADVARYQEFLPWVVAVRVRSSSETETVADLVVGFNAFKERFTSRVPKAADARSASTISRGRSNISRRVEVRGRAGRRHRGRFLRRFRVQVADVRGARRADVRPRAAADDRRVRAARRGALRHQQVERAKRRLKPDARAAHVVEQFLVGDDLGRVGVALGAGEDDGADRLRRRSAAGPGDAGDRDRDVGVRRQQARPAPSPRRSRR